ncbi:MAG: methylated-DNA--[protein]-cysteine S-methyltransferase, partial [Acidimicrobiia bacterium]|nr:methylated-DNA--[protein]-cysteine S-methyltransferase [Acidimicrobiia bacterium]
HDQHYTTIIDSPLGPLTLVATDKGLRAVLWPDDEPTRVRLPDAAIETDATDHPVLRAATSQLDEYFAGTRSEFEVPLDLRGTEFQVANWTALAEIRFGTTSTYGEQAGRLGRPKAARAIGAATGKNPISIILPCHRVVGSDGSLTGFAGGLDAKRWLLAHEGAR